MPPFALRYVASLSVLLAAYGIYALAAAPFIEPGAKFKETSAEEPQVNNLAQDAMERQKEELAGLFPEGAWELSSPKVLATDQGKLLFREYQPLPDGRLELKPCTLVFFVGGSDPRNDTSHGRPIVLRAPSAELKFDRAPHLGQTDMGRLLGGRLLGKISITSRETEPGADDELDVETRNVQLDEQHIWTSNEVRFRYGASFGSGRDLNITLMPKDKSAGAPKHGLGLESGGIKSLELVQVDKLHLVASGGSLLPANESPGQVSPAAAPLPVEVTCRGPFRFDFVKLIASFEDHVAVERRHPTGALDSLECQLLELYFDKAGKNSAGPKKPGSSRMSGLDVQRLVAIGHPVVLRAAGAAGASAKGQRFEYDLRTRRILLEDSQKATLVHERHSIEARGVAYELGEPGKLGRLWASGPGTFRARLGTDGKQQFEATWGKELRLRPHQGAHVISLSRDATLGFSSQGGMRADDIHIWLRETPSEADSNKTTVSPDKLLAIGNVQIDSPQLSGQAPRLEAWFKTIANDDVEEPGGVESSQTLPRGATDGPPGFPARDDARSAQPAQKFHLTGNLIQVQFLRRGSETAAENVTVDGKVRLVELPSAKLAEPPLEMQGDLLQIFQASSRDARARVTGQPAQLAARGMKLSGTNLQFHRGENRVWIDGAGQMVLPAARNPLAAMPRGGVGAIREAAPKPPIPAGQSITVTWQQRMNFDGQTVRFEKQVEARGETQFARGELLEVTLNRRFDFSNPQPADGVDVERLAFDGGVSLENRAVENRQVAAIERLQARKLSLDNRSGRLHAVGPGWVSSVRLGSAVVPGVPGVPGAANADSKPNDGLSYLHIDFQTALVGNLAQREIQFIDRVNAVYGPIDSWDQKLSKERIEDLPEKGVLLNCDRLSVIEMGEGREGQKFYEMQAAGNTRVEGKTFTATADRMSYAQAKELIVLEGDGRADAELWRQARVGGPTEHAAARKILYWQRDNRAQVDDARFLDLSQFGSPPPPREAPRK